jgi:hypothetical protein
MLFYFLLPAVVSYLVLVRTLRYRRVNQIQKQFGSTPEQFQNLNYRDAQTIIGKLGLYECPWTFLAGKDFAFLRVRYPFLRIRYSFLQNPAPKLTR